MCPQQNSDAESSDSSAAIIAILKLSMKIVGGLLAIIIIALIGTAYWGIDSRLKSLEEHFQAAILASADVKHLLTESPNLKQTINETHDAVIRLQDSHAQMREQLNSMQNQIHQILSNVSTHETDLAG
jgi:hypothetical protein